ncbi:MAG: RNA methyltransferase [Pseudomonadota bacterium]
MTITSDRLIRITDPEDARIGEFRDIRERDLVGREGRFIAEGTVVLRMLSSSKRFKADKLLILENRVEGITDILERFDADIPIFVCSRSVIDSIAGFPMHRGVLAAGRAAETQDLNSALGGMGDDALILVCNGISNHDNMGGLFRNAAAFCADLVCLDEECCDPMYRKAIRVSVGAALTVPFTRQLSIEVILRTLIDHGFDIIALSPDAKVSIQNVEPGRRCALVVGTEGSGICQSALELSRTIRIPQAQDIDSLNVATAAALALFFVASGQGRI